MGIPTGRRLAALFGAAALVTTLAIAAPPQRAYAASGTNVTAQQTLINQDRAAQGLPALQWSDCLGDIAVQNAQRMVAQGFISHTNGPTLDLACGIGSTHAGENVGFTSAGIDDPGLNTAFMNSPGHRANIMGDYGYVGTAWAVAPNGSGYIAVEFLTAPAPIVSGGYQALSPARILDTRNGTGGVAVAPIGPAGTLTLQVAGRGGIPSSGVSAVVLNVTVTNTTSAGYLTVYPREDPQPVVSNLNWVAGQTVPNLVQVALADSGQLALYNAAGTVDVVADVEGYVPTTATAPGPAGLFHPLVPARILDTRVGNGASGLISSGGTISLQVAGRGGVPATGVAAVVLNLTATNATGTGYVTVFPAGSARPLASNLNIAAGQTVANRVVARLGAGGQLAIFNFGGNVDAVADVSGWFTDASQASATGTTFVGVTPVRILDTRTGLGGAGGALGPGGSIALTVAGFGGVPLMTSTAPSPATAVVLNVTVTNPTTGSYLTAWPDGSSQPLASDLNFTAGRTVPNLVIVGLGPNGKIDIFNSSGSADVIVDVVGWYG